jgi:hypothetical protein
VPLAGQAACIAAFESCALGTGALGGGALGCGALTCAVCTVDVARGLWRGGSTVTCGNGAAFGCCCAGVAGDEDASGCVAFCAGVPGDEREGTSCAGVPGDDGDSSDCVAPCSAGGDAWARTSLAPAAASARELTERSASLVTALMQ